MLQLSVGLVIERNPLSTNRAGENRIVRVFHNNKRINQQIRIKALRRLFLYVRMRA